MNIFLKATAGVLTALILWIVISRHTKDFSVLLTLAVCAMVVTVAIGILQPVVRFLQKLQEMVDLDNDLLTIVLKVVGIGLITELSALICKDSGNESMGKALQLLSTATVLWLSIPVFEKLLSLLDKILGTV